MNQAVTYAIAHWAMAGLFILAAYGAGALFGRATGLRVRDMHAVWSQWAVGFGLLMTAFMALALMGQLRASRVWTLLALLAAVGVVCGARSLVAWRSRFLPAHANSINLWPVGVRLGIAIPLFSTYFATGLVPRMPTAMLSTGLMLSAMLSLVCGVLLHQVTLGRREAKHLAYLQVPPPSALLRRS